MNYLELLDLFKELSYTIDIVTLINANILIKKTNPKIMPYVWQARGGSQFHKQIQDRDINFFVDNDCSDIIINSIEFTTETLKDVCVKLIEHYRIVIKEAMNDSNKVKIVNKLMDKVVNVTNLANKYIEIDK